jgi:tetratricopeptide (TPR) repeat protein
MSPRTAWECYALGRALLRNGDLETAAAALDRAVDLQPRSLWAQFYRGQCALRRGRHAEAVDAFGACVALAPEAVCYYNRSLAYAGLGAHDRARLDLERARALDPNLHVNPREIAPRPATERTPVSR